MEPKSVQKKSCAHSASLSGMFDIVQFLAVALFISDNCDQSRSACDPHGWRKLKVLCKY